MGLSNTKIIPALPKIDAETLERIKTVSLKELLDFDARTRNHWEHTAEPIEVAHEEVLRVLMSLPYYLELQSRLEKMEIQEDVSIEHRVEDLQDLKEDLGHLKEVMVKIYPALESWYQETRTRN